MSEGYNPGPFPEGQIENWGLQRQESKDVNRVLSAGTLLDFLRLFDDESTELMVLAYSLGLVLMGDMGTWCLQWL
jgi:hypothetical protein